MNYDTRPLDTGRMVIPSTYDPSKSRHDFDPLKLD